MSSLASASTLIVVTTLLLGCVTLGGDSSPAEPWSAVADAFQTRHESTVVLTLLNGDPTNPESVAVSIAEFSLQEFSIDGTILPHSAVRSESAEGVVHLRVEQGRFHNFSVSGTFLLDDGREVTIQEENWLTVVWPPWHLSSSIICSQGELEFLLRPYERKPGAVGADYMAEGGGALQPLVPSVSSIEEWVLQATASDGTQRTITEVEPQERFNTLRSRVGLSELVELDYAFSIRLDDGLTLSEDDFGRGGLGAPHMADELLVPLPDGLPEAPQAFDGLKR